MHPTLFQFGPFTIHSFGAMVALGFVVGLWTASRRALRAGISAEKVLDIGPWLIVGAILGARTLFVVSYWREEFAGKPWFEVFTVWRGGLVYYGGLIGASAACILYTRIKKIPLWSLADVMAPSIALGQAFGRIGCLLNGCCYGRSCGLPWAIQFPAPHATHPLDGAPTPVHPTEIYEALLDLTLCAVLAWLFHRRKFDGCVFGFYLVGYALLRSVVEAFRGDYPQYYLGWITPAQLVSAGILLAGLLLLRFLPRPAPGECRGP